MRTGYLATAAVAAALTLSAAPAAAQFAGPPMGSQAAGVRLGDHCRDGRCGRTNIGIGVDLSSYYGGEWALYNNRSWNADSYNDWWHERPERAYPRWVRQQQRSGQCTEDRMWWSGSGWRC